MKRQIRKDKREWLENIVQEAEEAARSQLYGFTKILSNERPIQSTAVKCKEGNLLTNSEDRKV